MLSGIYMNRKVSMNIIVGFVFGVDCEFVEDSYEIEVFVCDCLW